MAHRQKQQENGLSSTECTVSWSPQEEIEQLQECMSEIWAPAVLWGQLSSRCGGTRTGLFTPGTILSTTTGQAIDGLVPSAPLAICDVGLTVSSLCCPLLKSLCAGHRHKVLRCLSHVYLQSHLWVSRAPDSVVVTVATQV